MFEFRMVPRGVAFLEAIVTDWCVLGKSSELRLINDGEASIFINPPGADDTFLTYNKVGLEQGMSRYERSTSMYADVVLLKTYLMTARVEVNIRRSATHSTRRLDGLLKAPGLFILHRT